MKKLIFGAVLALALTAAMPLTTQAKKAASPLSPSYQAVYCYPTGSYWQAQIAAYPAYYAANNAYYASHYGTGTIYCP